MTTYLDADHGPLLKCDNDTILCSTEEWLVDGSVNMRTPAQATTLFSDIDHPSFGSLLCENRNELLQEHGSNILVGEELFYNDVSNTSTLYLDISRAATTFNDVTYA